MKDYSVLNGMIENQKSELRTAYDKGYNQCVKDFNLILEARKKEEEGYNRGLEDAWACCKRFLNSDDKVCDKIFGVSGWADFLDQSPSEAIEKFKEYDEKQEHIMKCCKNCKHSENGMVGNSKRCESCYYDRVARANTLFEPMETDNSKIEVGDEIICYGVGQKAVVFEVLDDNNYKCFSKKYGVTTEDSKSVKTGRRFPEMVELIKHMENTDA